MSVQTRSPLKVLGGNANSGNVNTNEQIITQGGGQAMSIYSGNAVLSGALTAAYCPAGAATGTGYDVLLFSGAGRLKDVFTHQQTSGVAITFYDAGVVSSGGPFAASGTKIVAVVPANTFGGGPAGSLFGAGPSVLGFDIPFQSGLAVALKSGQPGFTVTFWPEVNPNIG